MAKGARLGSLGADFVLLKGPLGLEVEIHTIVFRAASRSARTRIA